MKKVAVIFPGQGSQSKGMLTALSAAYPQVKTRFEQASAVIGEDLWHIVQEDEKGFLNQTRYTQPIMLAADIACYDILREETAVEPAAMAGHSLGEYAALCAAGAIDFEAAIVLVENRGKLMQEAVPYGEGAMAAILGLNDADVVTLCHAVKETVAPANYNAPGQVVIAGTKSGVEKVVEAAKSAGAMKAVVLPVSVPSHCELMKSAAAKFSFYLDKVNWHHPQYTIVYNVDANPRQNKDGIESALGAQLYKPVRWVACINALAEMGITHFIECGPGKVLTGLNKRINKNLQTLSFAEPKDVEAAQQFLEKA